MSKSKEKQTLGIFWGEESLYFSEISGQTLKSSYRLDHKQPAAERHTTTTFSELRPLTARLQDLLFEHEIKKPTIYLSIPTQDVIFRSFVIPWMQPNEIKNVVTFEASKYIPFALEDLSYAFHPVLLSSKENIKRYRVIFVAIKKETLDEYKNIFQHAGLNISIIEPSIISLIRLLSLKQLINEDKPIALIEHNDTSGKIAIVSKGVPHFVREFFLSIKATQNDEQLDPQTIYLRLVNEIKISLDYFNRQDNQLEVKDILFLTQTPSDDLTKSLEADLNMSVKSVALSSLVENAPEKDPNYTNSFGAALLSNSTTPTYFDLTGNETKQNQPKYDLKAPALNIKMILATVVGCAALLLGVHFLSKLSGADYTNKLNSMKNQLAGFDHKTKATLDQENQDIKTKLEEYKTIRSKTSLNQYLEVIPDLLPEGTWLENLTIEYESENPRIVTDQGLSKKEDRLKIGMSGYVYSENSREQFRLANNLLRNVKQSNLFSQQFKFIDFTKTQTQDIDNYTVTYFEIKCE